MRWFPISAEHQSPPPIRGRWHREAMTEGETARWAVWRSPWRSHTTGKVRICGMTVENTAQPHFTKPPQSRALRVPAPPNRRSLFPHPSDCWRNQPPSPNGGRLNRAVLQFYCTAFISYAAPKPSPFQGEGGTRNARDG